MYAYYKKYEAKNERVKGVYMLYPKTENLSAIPNHRSDDGVNVKIRFIDLMQAESSIYRILRKSRE